MSQSRILYTPIQEKRKSRLRARRSIFLSLGILTALGTTAAIIYVLQMPYFQINSIKISGLVSLDELEIRHKISVLLDEKMGIFFQRKSFFFLQSERVESGLKSVFPRIAAVSAAKIFPQELSVKISERNLWGIYCNDFKIETSPEERITGENIKAQAIETKVATCAYTDDTGFAYESAPASSGSLLLKIHGDGELKITSQAISSEFVVKMREFSEMLKNTLGMEIVGFEFSFQIQREFRALTSDGFSLWINRDDDFAGVIKVLKTVLDEEIKDRRAELEYADLRFGNKVFYRYRQ